MKLISWNVNGLRACMNKGFADFMAAADADVFCVQETKMQGNRPPSIFPVTLNTGTARRRKAIPVRRCSRRRTRCR